jgi:hypothetical protein
MRYYAIVMHASRQTCERKSLADNSRAFPIKE